MRSAIHLGRHSSWLTVVLAVIVFSSLAARGDVVTVSYTGRISEIAVIDPSLTGLFAVGDAVSGTLAYDTATAVPIPVGPGCPDATSGCYFVSGSSSFSWGGVSLAATPTSQFEVYVGNDLPVLGDDIELFGVTIPGVNGSVVTLNIVRLIDYTGTALSSTALPVTINPSAFSSLQYAELDLQNPGVGHLFDGVAMFDSLTVVSTPSPVPEPATIALLLLAIPPVLLKARRH